MNFIITDKPLTEQLEKQIKGDKIFLPEFAHEFKYEEIEYLVSQLKEAFDIDTKEIAIYGKIPTLLKYILFEEKYAITNKQVLIYEALEVEGKELWVLVAVY